MRWSVRWWLLGLLLMGLTACGDTPSSLDAAAVDAAITDATVTDAAGPDAGTPDAGTPDAGTPDAGTPDAGIPDAAVLDAPIPDAAIPDAAIPDAAVSDAAIPDAAVDAPIDAAVPDAPVDAPVDAAVPDAPIDAPVDAPADAADLDAPVDAAAPDAPIDAPIDAPGPCVLPPFTAGVSTVTGCADPGATDGVRGTAKLANPVNVAVGPDGDIYIADFDNHRIRVSTPTGTVRTLTQQANFIKPFGLAFTAAGDLYVQTDDNPQGQHSPLTGTLWRVDTATGVATPLAQDLGRPRGLTALADGRLALADYVHHVIQLYDPVTNLVSPLAGAFDAPGFVDDVGGAARFAYPYGVVQLADGSLAVAELGNHVIRRVALDGTVSTLAGTGVAGNADGAALAASFSGPQALALAADGALYITDTNNFVIRRLRAGVVDTPIGSGVDGWLDHDVPTAAQLHGLEGIGLDQVNGRLYIADGCRGEPAPYHRVRVSILPP